MVAMRAFLPVCVDLKLTVYGSSGDGKTFPRNPKAASYLVKLAEDLVKAEAGRW